MDETFIKQLVQQELSKYFKESMFRPTDIPFHTHDGVNSPRIKYTNLIGAPSGGGGGSTSLNPQIPAGLINGVNVTFTISGTISLVTQNGQVLDPTTQWTVAGTTLTLVVAPLTGDSLYAY